LIPAGLQLVRLTNFGAAVALEFTYLDTRRIVVDAVLVRDTLQREVEVDDMMAGDDSVRFFVSLMDFLCEMA